MEYGKIVIIIFAALLLIFFSGICSLLFYKNNYLSSFLGTTGIIIGCAVGIYPAIKVLFSGSILKSVLPWQMPYGNFSFLLDPLSAFFITIIFLISGISSLYGFSYFKKYFSRKNIAIPWFMISLLIISMVLVCLAQNALFFLISWELMTISSFFLVVFEYDKIPVRKAGWAYLISTHIGTSVLFLMFLIYGKYSGSLEFSTFKNILPPNQITICLILAIIGFGTKSGIIPFHVWLPEAHPVAPSHVSAIMSGVMIKTGIYALLRIISFNIIPLWLGYSLIIIGITSGILGVLFAIAQHDLKRLLAYHSIENIGIIFIGLGVGFIGLSLGNTTVFVLGFSGGLLHVLNHAIFKSLLFLGAGSISHSTNTLEIDILGGLLKKMPVTGTTFLIGSIAITGLPPLNGFVSEFLIYLAMFTGVLQFASNNSLIMISGIISLALIGGLAIACFTKVFGTIFLGEPRKIALSNAEENDSIITFPLVLLSGFCISIGLLGPIIIKLLKGIIEIMAPSIKSPENHLLIASNYLFLISIASIILLLLTIFFMVLRYFLLRGKVTRETVTWDCGYNFPSEKMQYTGSSFVQPITDMFNFILRTKKIIKHSDSYFPENSIFESDTPDVVRKKIYQPLFLSIKKIFSYFSIIQQGRIQVYISYIVLTLLALLLWNSW